MKEALKTKPFIILNVSKDDPKDVKILASNKIDVGDMSGKFEFFNKQFGASGPKSGMVGNHLILFDGKKQQIIKLDASIGLKQLAQKTI